MSVLTGVSETSSQTEDDFDTLLKTYLDATKEAVSVSVAIVCCEGDLIVVIAAADADSLWYCFLALSAFPFYYPFFIIFIIIVGCTLSRVLYIIKSKQSFISIVASR